MEHTLALLRAPTVPLLTWVVLGWRGDCISYLGIFFPCGDFLIYSLCYALQVNLVFILRTFPRTYPLTSAKFRLAAAPFDVKASCLHP